MGRRSAKIDSLWELKKGVRNSDGVTWKAPESVRFIIAPSQVRVIPRFRTAVEDTLDGRIIMPWIDPLSGTNVGNIDIELEGIGNIYLVEKQTVSEQVTAEDARVGLTELFKLTLSPYMKPNVHGRLQHEIWQLRWITPLFRKDMGGEGVIVLMGYITTPMQITERADNPWMPNWGFTFSIWGESIDTFLKELKRIPGIPVSIGAASE